MRWRDFIKVIVGSGAAWPLAARAQQGERTRRIGVLMNLSETDSEGQARIAAFREGLNKLGWLEGRNIQIEYRWAAGNPERIRAFAAELVALKPEAIFAAPFESAAALQRETRTVPIVFAQAGDPVASGLVASVPRPGGNITGFALYEFAIAAQWVDLLKQIAPNITRVAVIYYPATPGVTGYLPMMEAAARIHAVEISSYAVRDDVEVEQAIETFAREPNGGLIPLPSTLIATHREFIISLASHHRLPNIFAYRYYPANGGLASYGADNIDGYRRAADYVDRILKGEKPADLPVQFPTKYELVINLKAAKALGLTIPPSLLATADEVIE
jgi:putative tryptophan/tyrosine transport system substrate-binding protein